MPNNFFGDAYQTNMAEENLVLPQAREPKRRFVPSKWEAKAVLRIIRSLRKNPDARARTDPRPRRVYVVRRAGDVLPRRAGYRRRFCRAPSTPWSTGASTG